MRTPPDQPAALVAVSTLALLIADLDPGLPARLLAEHTADRSGCCRSCSLPQGGPSRWPCTLYAVATEVTRYTRSRRLPGR